MQDKADTKKALARRKQQALRYVLEREQWSHGLQQQRKAAYTAEVEQLRQQLAATERERDSARESLEDITRKHHTACQARDTAVAERDVAEKTLEAAASEYEAVRMALETVTGERDAMRQALAATNGDVDALRDALTQAGAERDATRQALDEALQDREAARKAQDSVADRNAALQRALETAAGERDAVRDALDETAGECNVVRHAFGEAACERDAAHQALETARAERDSASAQVSALESSVADLTRRLDEAQRLRMISAQSPKKACFTTTARATAAAGMVLAMATVLTTIAFDDAESHVNSMRQSDIAAVQALTPQPVPASEAEMADDRKSTPSSGKRKTRYVRARVTNHKQWGPALWLLDEQAPKPRVSFDPVIKEMQQNLLVLGFDAGEADGFNGAITRQAVKEFRALYLPEDGKQPPLADLAVIIKNYANLARNDAERFRVDRGVVAAIRLSSVRTGVDFSYLMKLAATESNFNPVSEAGSSSATGLYQFTHDTWLNTVRKHGRKYGLADYAGKIGVRQVNKAGFVRPVVKDEAVYQHLLALRKNPRISAMMAAESVRDNHRRLAYSFDREPAQTDLYLTHFLGADGAITFLKALKDTPDVFAVDMFPEAARSNHGIFHPKTCEPRTVDEVYALFGEKFSTRRYDDIASN